VIGQVELEENKKLPFVEVKHLKSYMRGKMMYHILFRNRYYQLEIRGQCY
jgi:hypothetical protein